MITVHGARPLTVAAALLIFVLTALVPLAPASAAVGENRTYEGLYAINLASYLEPVDPADVPALDEFAAYRLYTTIITRDGTVWYRLRLGFFADRDAAVDVVERLRREYPEAWVTKVVPQEKAISQKLVITVPGLEKRKEPAEAEDIIKGYMEDARRAMTAGEYAAAEGLYTAVLTSGDNRYVRQAREYLALAYERGGDLDRAKGEYRNYLILYPEGEGSERVRQRLQGVETALAKPRERLKKAARAVEPTTEVYGSFSQFYNRSENITDLGGNVITRSSISNDLDFSVRRRTGSTDLTATAIGGYEYDLLDPSNSETRLSRLYVDYLQRRWGLSFRGGRQSQSTGGVLGLFDGASLGYRFASFARLNLVAGFPTGTSVIDEIDTDRYFYGANMDLGTFFRSLDFNFFYIEQMAEGFVDRQAVGGEMRYFHRKGSFFTLVDYDTHYDELNSVLFTGSIEIFDRTRVSTSVDYRMSPVLTTTNALIGQAASSLTELRDTFTDTEIKELARDRTAVSKSATVSVNQPLGEKLQVGADVTVSEFTGTPASGGVAEVEGTGYEYVYALQFIGSSLVKRGDIAILGLQYSDASTSDTITVSLNTRLPLTRNWRVNPRVRGDYSRLETTGGERLRIRPSLRTDYYWKRMLRVEVEGGAEWTYDWVNNQTDNSFDYFVTAGYRLEF